MNTTTMDSGKVAAGEFDTVLDRDAIERLRRFGGDALLTKMIDLFISGAGERLDAARAAAGNRDCETVRRSMHSLKSSAGQLGAVTLQEICAQGEVLATDRIMGPLPTLVEAAREQFVAVVRLLQLVRSAAAEPDSRPTPIES